MNNNAQKPTKARFTHGTCKVTWYARGEEHEVIILPESAVEKIKFKGELDIHYTSKKGTNKETYKAREISIKDTGLVIKK